MQNEQDVQSALQGGGRTIFQFGHSEKHVKKIARITKIIIGIT